MSPWREVWGRVRTRWRRWRVGPLATRALGPRFRRSRDRIELDITWACNLRCFNCNRSCEQAPTGEHMTVAQVRRFVDDSLRAGRRWARIRVLGGEPTLHPELGAILTELDRYRAAVPSVEVQLATHGHGERVQAAVAALPGWVVVDDSHKDGPEPLFDTFNVAPIDVAGWRDADFANGCPVTETCGIGLGPRGYYPCAVAGAIDRVVGADAARPELPDPSDDLFDQLDQFCRMCGHFKRGDGGAVRGPVTSASWDVAYARWRAGRS
ncbi:MAG: radical SAM protein [Myxococcota bacterium]